MFESMNVEGQVGAVLYQQNNPFPKCVRVSELIKDVWVFSSRIRYQKPCAGNLGEDGVENPINRVDFASMLDNTSQFLQGRLNGDFVDGKEFRLERQQYEYIGCLKSRIVQSILFNEILQAV